MVRVKLYIASSVAELKSKSIYQYDPNRSIRTHANHSETTFTAAEEARGRSDEERAYVLYMRYIDICQKVKNSWEFKNNVARYSSLLQKKKMRFAIGHAEVLSESLRQRYENNKNPTSSAHGQKTSSSENENPLPDEQSESANSSPIPPEHQLQNRSSLEALSKNASIIALQVRLEEMRKIKRDHEARRKELDEQMACLELEQAKRLEKEAADADTERRKMPSLSTDAQKHLKGFQAHPSMTSSLTHNVNSSSVSDAEIKTSTLDAIAATSISTSPESQLDPSGSACNLSLSPPLAQLNPTSGEGGPGQCGLESSKTDCMNSILQCLFNTPVLVQYFLSGGYKSDLKRGNPDGYGGDIADGFAVLANAVWKNNYKSISPLHFKNTISRFNADLFRHQDAEETLLFLLNALHEDINDRGSYQEPEDDDAKSDSDAAEIAWNLHKRLNESVIVGLFQGQFKTETQCSYCSKTSRRFDVFMHVSLPLSSRTKCSIFNCLDEFFGVEKMSGDNQWFCPSCKEHRNATRRMRIWKLPPVIVIHLQRRSARSGVKLDTDVTFPHSNLDINDYVIGPKHRNSYDLYAVSHHLGDTMTFGYHIASCKNLVDGNWYTFDNSEVSRSTEPRGSSCHILFYSHLSHTLNVAD